MIHLIEGDLLTAPCKNIGHQVNCRGVMGSGVAKQIKEKWPKVFEDYHRLCQEKNAFDLLGTVQFVNVGDVRIMNMFGQLNYGRSPGVVYTNIHALTDCCQTISQTVPADESIALPYRIGCGLGGANWDTVLSMLEHQFRHHEVYLYRLQK